MGGICDSKNKSSSPNEESPILTNNNSFNKAIPRIKNNNIINNNQTNPKILSEKINEISFRCYYEIKDYN